MDQPHYIVLLGASNLFFSSSIVLRRVLASYQDEMHIFMAHGSGRSYGLNAGNPLHRYVGISKCGLWTHLEASLKEKPGPLYVLLTDVGNDVLYTQGSKLPLRWVHQIIERLSALGARILVTSMPLASIQRLKMWQFALIRRLFFPGRSASMIEVIDWVKEIQHELEHASKTPGIMLGASEPHWYGMDHFHIKMSQRANVFDYWLNQLLGFSAQPTVPLPLRPALLPLAHYWRFGQLCQHEQVGYSLRENASLYLY